MPDAGETRLDGASGPGSPPKARATASAFSGPAARKTTSRAAFMTGSVRVTRGTQGSSPGSGTPTDGVPSSDGMGDLQQSNLEQANVEAVTEISDLIAAQRAYEMNAKVISATDQMLQSTSNMMR